VTENQVQNETKPLSQLFPEGLIRWSGYRDGGVRRPFHQNSGRPTGGQIDTPLVLKLRDWANKLVDKGDVPRAILLVGGPGNGKTDAVEGCIESLDAALGAQGSLVERFESQYQVADGELPPRKVVVNTSDLAGTSKLRAHSVVSLVQDATEGDPAEGKSAEELLLADLIDLVDEYRSGIFLCCVNRGILAKVVSLAHENPAYKDSLSLLNAITEAVTSGPEAPKCWPLEKFRHIAVWPMDVESLVETTSDDNQTVAHQIFTIALDETKWKDPCDLGSRCPFCQNRKLLSRKGALDSLVRLLHYYELASGKRWTFRDLFSLVPYLLVGDYSELEFKGKRLTPCEWAAEQVRLSRETRESVDGDRAPYLLMTRLYFHRMFPTWPSFERGDHRTAKHELFREKYTDKGLQFVKGFFRFAARSNELEAKASGDVPDRVRSSLGPALDPALATGNDVLIARDDSKLTVTDIEEFFSLSIRDGLSIVGSQIETLERDVLSRLAEADESLSEDKFPRNRTRQARLLQMTLRQFSTRLVKRSLGSRRGVCKDLTTFQEYVNATHDAQGLSKVRRELRKLLHDSNNRFRAGLATTFGQPVAERSRDVALLLPKMISVGLIDREIGTDRPIDSLPYLRVENHYVAVTFELFRALGEVGKGLHEASLPAEIYSLLDRVKSLVSGLVVRDPNVLNDDPIITLGSSHDVIEYVGGQFDFTRGGR
jgi:hypothetical protein